MAQSKPRKNIKDTRKRMSKEDYERTMESDDAYTLDEGDIIQKKIARRRMTKFRTKKDPNLDAI